MGARGCVRGREILRRAAVCLARGDRPARIRFRPLAEGAARHPVCLLCATPGVSKGQLRRLTGPRAFAGSPTGRTGETLDRDGVDGVARNVRRPEGPGRARRRPRDRHRSQADAKTDQRARNQERGSPGAQRSGSGRRFQRPRPWPPQGPVRRQLQASAPERLRVADSNDAQTII